MKKEEILEPLRGWITAKQMDNISKAIDSGRFDMSKYLSLPAEYVEQNFDNGGFTKREQYALMFGN